MVSIENFKAGTDKIEIRNLAINIQESLLTFIRRVNDLEDGCMSRDIEVDGYMLIFHDEETWQKFTDFFDILGMSFTTGELDGKYKTWYIDFEFSDGISD